jgi:hypothetical protein
MSYSGSELCLTMRFQLGLTVRVELGLTVRVELGLTVRAELGLAVRVELSLSIFSEDSLSYNLLKDEGNPLEHWKAETAYFLLKSNAYFGRFLWIFIE